MKSVQIAKLKARLSEYLRGVRRGHELTVLDRDTPIARIVPYGRGATLTMRRPTPDAPRLGRVPLPPPLRVNVDAVALLLEERQGER
jgi:prevent-host-death family protein